MKNNKTIKIFVTRLLLSAAFTALIFALYSFFKHGVFQGIIHELIKDIEFIQDFLKKYDALTSKLVVSGISQIWTRIIIFLIFCGFAFRKTETISIKIVDNFFTDYPDTLLDPVTAPRLLIDPSQWAPPLVKSEGSHTERIYKKLLQFVLEGAEDCSKGRFYTVSDVGKQNKFTWAMITGRPGEGKSRIVSEVARQLSRRDIFGGQKQQEMCMSMATLGILAIYARTTSVS